MKLRNILFQIHLWVGLILGAGFILLGLTGSALMFGDVPGIGQRVSDLHATVSGSRLPLEQIIEAAKSAAASSEGAATVILPQGDGKPAEVRFGQGGGGFGRGNATPDVLVDPVTGKILGTFVPGQTAFMRVVHDLHEHLSMGGAGRQLVGWLGVGMTFLGFSGLYLWWPKKGQWKNAFIVRRKAKGLRFHRELHGAVGIWALIVFLVVSITGVAIVFPQPFQASLSLVGINTGPANQFGGDRGGQADTARQAEGRRDGEGEGNRRGRVQESASAASRDSFDGGGRRDAVEGADTEGRRYGEGRSARGGRNSGTGGQRNGGRGQGRGIQAPTVEIPDGVAPISADRALALAMAANPGLSVQSITVPARRNQAITVNMGEGRGTSVFIDPYRASLVKNSTIGSNNPNSFMGLVHRLHAGEGLGVIYWVAVLISGFLPALFVITGFMMWLKKRQNRQAVRQKRGGSMEAA